MDEYIYYNFLEHHLSVQLQNNATSPITLQNLTWSELDGYSQCTQSTTSTMQTGTEAFFPELDAVFEAVTQFLPWFFAGIFSISCLVIVIGYIHSWIVWNADLAIGYGVFFCFSMFDWYSDVIFTFTIRSEHIEIFLASFCLLLFPLIGNVVWLLRQQKIWEHDAAIGARVKTWLLRWRPFLYSLTILSGSSFGAVNLCMSVYLHSVYTI